MPIELPQSKRVELNLSPSGLSEVPIWGIDRQTFAEDGIGTHHHGGCLEIHYIVTGEQTFELAGTDYTLGQNELFLTLPWEEHSFGGHPHGRCEIYWTHILVDPVRPDFLGLNRADAESLVGDLILSPRRQFAGTPAIRSLFEEVFLLAQQDLIQKRLMLGTRIAQWLLEVIRCSRQPVCGQLSDDIREIIERIVREPWLTWTVPQMAKIACLSESRFKAKFRREVGTPPMDFVLRQKINAADRRLSMGLDSVTELAHWLGFSSSNYFSKVYRRYTNQLPSARLKQGRADNPGADERMRNATRWFHS